MERWVKVLRIHSITPSLHHSITPSLQHNKGGEVSEYTVTIHWTRRGAIFIDNRYSREHTWKFDGGVQVPASASPHVVPLPLSNASCVDPEEAFVASLSSCHMLWFLSIAAKRGFVVEDYVDQADGLMERNGEGRLAITHVTLHPVIRYGGDRLPTDAEIEEIHHQAHESCFLANSVKTTISVAAPKPISAENSDG
jgi:organic hydroperoxide reductase OsmC/OhrA